MKELRLCIILSIILFILSMFINGCAIGIKPRSYEVPPEGQYYSDTTYDSYYTSPRASTYYYYDPNYDPWTMGTYYQHYSGPPQTYGSPGGSSSYIENKRPDSSGSDSASQSQAPGDRDINSKTDRSSIRNRDNITPGSSESSMDSQKVRREIPRESQNSQSDDKIEHRRLKSRITSSQQDSSETQDEDEQNK